jgi:NAD(P)-dependent dehydrogenase (short-subunit alcohol dehydrogenase family)
MRRSGSSKPRYCTSNQAPASSGTTSEQAYDPSPDLYDDAQTKAATMNYVKPLAKQFGSKGIRVNGGAPGPIWTPLQISGGAPEHKYEKFGSTTVLGLASGARLDLRPVLQPMTPAWQLTTSTALAQDRVNPEPVALAAGLTGGAIDEASPGAVAFRRAFHGAFRPIPSAELRETLVEPDPWIGGLEEH